MTGCTICEHKKVDIINAALARGRLVPVVAQQFRLEKLDLVKHLQHAPIQAMSTTGGVIGLPSRTVSLEQASGEAEQRVDALHLVAYHFKQAARAWREVDASRKSDERLQMILQEAFQSDDMGLP